MTEAGKEREGKKRIERVTTPHLKPAVDVLGVHDLSVRCFQSRVCNLCSTVFSPTRRCLQVDSEEREEEKKSARGSFSLKS